ncbi:NAD(P)/FAD-dependent oxidoreductase [Salmonella enterica subsp. enterica]|nr:NAD(P)/FAD-dependent oxidoreductase [Salmonella enterica]EBQ9479953.1 NAD(P)/FAD-dependent oxidoreductase [Salmonella enterica subsp. enterica serovar Kokomlemle]ECS5198526.1 NAD(P)/FAD-dependent oxidoreductase [Salmonella enterica subsp. enterica serovar Poano]EBJ7122018.1 NAD(P)/FAD-dependent oxidoreductase [Salmonella enterica]ECX4750935.1 NAD(P)/FAD-dependent oxidoreductase [Salmonella enterica]
MSYDVLIVGGSVAGAACSVLLRQMGLRVRVMEKVASPSAYKKLCTHFIQPSAVPVLSRLNMDYLTSAENSVRTRATFITPVGIIDPEGFYGDDCTRSALNLERSVLDPALRREAQALGVEFGYAERVTEVQRLPEGWRLTVEKQEKTFSVEGRFLIAADGRTSVLARLLGNPTQRHENQRATYFAYCSGINAPADNRSLFAHHQNGMAFLYPLARGRTLLSAYIAKETAQQWQQQDLKTMLINFFASVPSMPAMDDAIFETPVMGYQDYPNLIRQPVCQNVAFIGDAAQSLDPMSGVGCSFALQTAAMLSQAVEASLHHGVIDEQSALQTWQRLFNDYFPPHARGIIADALIAKENQGQKSIFQTIVNDEGLQRQYRDLTGRLISPAAFQNAFLLSKVRQNAAARKAQEA